MSFSLYRSPHPAAHGSAGGVPEAVTVVLILVTAAAVFSRTGSSIVDILPILIGGAAGVFFLVTVFRRQLTDPGDADASAASESASGQVPTEADSPVADATPLAADPENPKASRSGTGHPMGPATGSRTVGRRQFFKIAGIGALIAAGAGAVAKWIPSGADVAASRASVALPTPADAQRITINPFVLRLTS